MASRPKSVQESCLNVASQKTEAGINLERELLNEAIEKNFEEHLDNICNAAKEKIYKMKEEFRKYAQKYQNENS
ncbi:hypothetical protein JTE90_004242 [Oedothorax gibbosus]|uniref:Uncharacterized protein n=1 Tax=Oedothorax gibbosus TaxID=931172 RepID=A0AAV6TP51_9ARAC|nr:hypothetical protein JTE90_004242 [Oedothorax gibbosus]